MEVVVLFDCNEVNEVHSRVFQGVYTDGVALRNRLADLFGRMELNWKGQGCDELEASCVTEKELQAGYERISNEIEQASLEELMTYSTFVHFETDVVMDY